MMVEILSIASLLQRLGSLQLVIQLLIVHHTKECLKINVRPSALQMLTLNWRWTFHNDSINPHFNGSKRRNLGLGYNIVENI